MRIVDDVRWRLRRMIKTLIGDPLVFGVLSFLLGIAASLWPQTLGALALVILILAATNRLVEMARMRRRAEELTQFELALRRPDPDALRRSLQSEAYLVFDKVIEILPHWNLKSAARFNELGWDVQEIEVKFSNEVFDSGPILSRTGAKNFDPPNGRKFSLVDRSLGGTDSNLTLWLRETDYFTIRSVLSDLSTDRIDEFGSLDPRHNLIPHSLCLHSIVRCRDGDVLCMLNDVRKMYAGGVWSVSAEEQLKDVDLEATHPIEALFQRALLEEIVGLSNELLSLASRWDLVKSLVRSMRVWSLFVEDHLNNFTLLGVCQLNVSATELRVKLTEFISNGSSARDLEGRLFVIPKRAVEPLLVTGSATVQGLLADTSATIHDSDMHWTSRYRMFRLLRALGGAPIPSPR